MSRTIRWWHRKVNLVRLSNRRVIFMNEWVNPWDNVNPYWFKHETKFIRIELRRKQRHRNKIRIRKGMDILPELRTCGWESN